MQTVKEVMKGYICKTTKSYKCNWTQQNWKSNAKMSGHCWDTYLLNPKTVMPYTLSTSTKIQEKKRLPLHICWWLPGGKGIVATSPVTIL